MFPVVPAEPKILTVHHIGTTPLFQRGRDLRSDNAILLLAAAQSGVPARTDPPCLSFLRHPPNAAFSTAAGQRTLETILVIITHAIGVSMMSYPQDGATQVADLFYHIFSSQHEKALVSIGHGAYREIVSLASNDDKQILDRAFVSTERTSPKEIIDILKLMRNPIKSTTYYKQKTDRDRVYFRDLAKILGCDDEHIWSRWCIEFPKLFEILLTCRNKRSHLHDISEHWLGLLCSTMLSVVELAHDDWLPMQQRESILRATREGLAFIVAEKDRLDDDDDDEDDLILLRAQLETALTINTRYREEINRLTEALNSEPNVQRQIDDVRNTIIGRIEQLSQDIEKIASHMDALQDDADARDVDLQIVEHDKLEEPHGITATRPISLTREMARQRCRTTLRELKKRLPGLPYDINIFHPIVVNEALDHIAEFGELTQDQWWQLSAVRKRKSKDERNIKEQMTIDDGRWQEKMIDIYSRFAHSMEEGKPLRSRR